MTAAGAADCDGARTGTDDGLTRLNGDGATGTAAGGIDGNDVGVEDSVTGPGVKLGEEAKGSISACSIGVYCLEDGMRFGSDDSICRSDATCAVRSV